MKNIAQLITPDEVQKYVHDLWRTNDFRASHESGGLVGKYVERYSRLPRLFADMSDVKLETPHFSAWWNVITRRDTYTNPAIHDLYHLHEIIHDTTISHIRGISFDTFQRKMNENELETSLATEILVYFDMPDLRNKSFEHDIYADRFMNDRAFRRFWETDREGAIPFLRERRREVMFSNHPEKLDPIEGAINLYAAQNTQWQMVWKIRYGEVEQAMDEFKKMARGSPDRAAALQHLLAWLEDKNHTRGTDVPFRREAEAFSSIYWNNKNHYQEMIAALTRQSLRPLRAAPPALRPAG